MSLNGDHQAYFILILRLDLDPLFRGEKQELYVLGHLVSPQEFKQMEEILSSV